METTYTIKDWDDKINPAINKVIDDHLLKYSVQIFEKKDKGYEPFGSGVLMTTHDNHFLLTASHVIDYLSKADNQLFIRVDHNKLINISGTINFTDYKKNKIVDLGYIKLHEEMLQHLGPAYKFIMPNKISKHTPRLEGSNYCALGFPTKNFKYDGKDLKTGASFYVTNAANQNPYDYYKLNPDLTIIVNMKGKGADLLNGGKAKIDNRFWGMSGGGLWYLNYDQDEKTKEFTVDYRLVGILTEFRNDRYYCFFANKIHLIIDAFRQIEGFKFNQRPR